MARRTGKAQTQAMSTSLEVVGGLLVITLAQSLFPSRLIQFGIVPRSAWGLWGIAFAPLLHASLTHYVANALPLFVLLSLLLANPRYRPERTLAWIWIGSGLGTWLIGRPGTVHIGASSIVFGLAAFLILAGVRLRSWTSLAVAVFVGVAFGGIFYGVLPQAGPISWEGHLCGALAGAWTAWRGLRSR